MLKKYFTILLAGFLIFNVGSVALVAQTQSDNTNANAAKIKAAVLKRGASEKKRVRVKLLNGSKLDGYITQTGEDSFTFLYSKTRQTGVVAYRDVKHVEGRGLAGGAKIGIIVGAAVAATLIALRIIIGDALD